MPSRASSVAFFVALLASALMLGPALAHAFELPAKIGLSREEYFIVQQIYRGWAGFSLVLVVIGCVCGACGNTRISRALACRSLPSLASSPQ
jgi:hypothetical protein